MLDDDHELITALCPERAETKGLSGEALISVPVMCLADLLARCNPKLNRASTAVPDMSKKRAA